MGCMCCCFRPPREEEPSSLVKKGDSPAASPRKSYGAITIQEETPNLKPASPSPKSPSDLLYKEPPKSARVKSPETTKDEEPSSSRKSPEKRTLGKSAHVKSPETTKGEEPSSSRKSPEKRTLAEIAEAAERASSAFPSIKESRTSTPSPSVDNKNNAKAEGFEERGVDIPADAPLIPPGEQASAYGSHESIESETCHSIGEEEEEESEDARILRMLPDVPPASSSEAGGSQTHLVPKTPSPGSSTRDVSKDSKKQSKAKDFMKKAGKNMKKAKKKVGKGMEKMIPHSKKKEEDTQAQGDTKEKADSSANETSSSSSSQFKRVSSERMKSKYARDKLAALEKKREEEASHKSSQGFTDPRQVAHERGEKLGELEDKTEQMRDHAASFAHNVSLLKNRHASTS